jgi:hypothetical protein
MSTIQNASRTVPLDEPGSGVPEYVQRAIVIHETQKRGRPMGEVYVALAEGVVGNDVAPMHADGGGVDKASGVLGRETTEDLSTEGCYHVCQNVARGLKMILYLYVGIYVQVIGRLPTIV